MVSFSCEVCNDTILKKKLDQHRQRCNGAYFTCIDCSTTFSGTDYKNHTSCITEAEKYEKGLHKPKKATPINEKNGSSTSKIKQGKQQKNASKTAAKEDNSSKDKTKHVVSDKKQTKKLDLEKYVSSSKQESFYKILKKLAKDKDVKKKKILEQLKVCKNENGSISLTL
ncbi:uncharacterized protein PRCAT00003150001 [Priceomyces carsonii]|uniref:uncharacterized protein n=1 Tax=Priceomyces carsonii TaxID=28549 RepID=UPI002EDAEAF5|nr:unnamed protein product [Priceomyces carsonii]